MSTELFRALRKGAVPMAVINPDTGLPPQRRDYGKLLCCDTFTLGRIDFIHGLFDFSVWFNFCNQSFHDQP